MSDEIIKVAVIDLGTNSLRFQIVEVSEGQFEIVEDIKEIIRLGDDIYTSGKILPHSLNNLIGLLVEIKKICNVKNVSKIRFIATASLREAENGEDVANAIFQTMGIKPEVITGEKEAEFAYLASIAHFEIDDSNILITDIGGGSAEFVIIEEGEISYKESTSLGCNRLSHKFLTNDPPTLNQIGAIKEYISDFLKNRPFNRKVEHIICLGGTLNNVANVQYKNSNQTTSRVRYVDRKFLKKFLRIICDKPMAERIKIPGLEPKRGDLVIPATILIDSLMDICGKSGFYTLSSGLRIGILIDTLNSMGIKLTFQSKQDSLRVSRVLDICKKYKAEIAHLKHVNTLSFLIFNQLKEFLKLTDSDRDILEAASLLHDIGNYISYSQHHKHSYYLIKNSDLIGYTDDETDMIANVARYHRKSQPKKTHENFMKLDVCQKDKVKILSAILRLADALDRSHDQRVKEILIDIQDDAIKMRLIGRGDLTLEINGLEKKKDFFESLVSMRVEL